MRTREASVATPVSHCSSCIRLRAPHSDEEGCKFLEVELTILVLVELIDQTLNLQRHAKLVPDDRDEAVCIHEAALVGRTTQRNKCINRVELILQLLRTTPLLFKSPQELRKLDFASAILIHVGHEPEELLFTRGFANGLEQQLHLLCVDGARAILVEGVEGLTALLNEALIKHHP